MNGFMGPRSLSIAKGYARMRSRIFRVMRCTR